jgi:hypothetical protein
MSPLTFTASGNIDGAPAVLRVRDGQPEGDERAVALVADLIECRAPVSIPGIWAGKAGLDDERAAMATIDAVFDADGTLRVEGLVVPERYGWAPPDSVQ